MLFVVDSGWDIRISQLGYLFNYVFLLCRREDAMQRALQNAVSVPMSVAKATNGLWDTLKELAKIGNLNCKSDLQVSNITVNTSFSL